jgi:signal transduction histidine kinase
MTGLKLDTGTVRKNSGGKVGSGDRGELRWLHQRIEELGASLAGQQDEAREVSARTEKIVGLASMASGSVIYDLGLGNGRFRMLYGVREMLGFDPEEVDLTHSWWRDRIHPEDRQWMEARFAGAVEEGTGCRLRYRIRHKAGHYIRVEEVMQSYSGAPGLPGNAIGCVMEVCDRPAAEESTEAPARGAEVPQAREWMLRAERLESVNRDLQDLTSTASRNLLDPLRKIRVFGEMIESKWSGSTEGREYLARMQKAALRMQAVLEGLQTYAQLDSRVVPFSEVDLGRTVREAVASLKERMDDTGAEVEVGELPRVHGDSLQIRLLFQNLIENGLKFHSEGRRPHVRIWADPAMGQAPCEAGTCRILVEDNGIGFEEGKQADLFNPFQRIHGKDEVEGAGMGLALCKKIMSRHGGGIAARSAVGRGSTFILTFPGRER